MSKNNFAKDLMAALKDHERQKQFDGEAHELGEYVLEILDGLRKSTRTMDERKETKIFDNMKDSGCEAADEVKIRYDIRDDEFLCDITSVCGKTGDEGACAGCGHRRVCERCM